MTLTSKICIRIQGHTSLNSKLRIPCHYGFWFLSLRYKWLRKNKKWEITHARCYRIAFATIDQTCVQMNRTFLSRFRVDYFYGLGGVALTGKIVTGEITPQRITVRLKRVNVKNRKTDRYMVPNIFELCREMEISRHTEKWRKKENKNNNNNHNNNYRSFHRKVKRPNKE